jgi:ABC-type glycerol-3-phosphate transport system substrate-binding protein
LAACVPVGEDTPVVSAPTETITANQPADSTPLPSSDTQVATIWVPPSLGPDTAAGLILSEHLAEFQSTNPQISVNLRVKEESGVSGILETLTAAHLAAPSTLPDIALLNPTALHIATLKGLISPLNEIVEPPQPPDWYEYTISAAFVDDLFVAIPLSSEASAFAYRRAAFESEPRKWTDLISTTETLLLPLGENAALFTLILYKEMGGKLTDQNGYPTIDLSVLTDILEFLVSAREAGILPLFTLQLDSPEDSLASLQQGFANSAIIPIQSYIDQSLDEDFVVSPWPTRGGLGVVPTRSLSWVVVDKNEIKYDLISQLLRWLQDPAFLGQMAFSMNSLPVTSTALDFWPIPEQASTISRLSLVATSQPSAEELATFGNSLQAAIEDVMNDQETPEAAGRKVLEQVLAP